jgi:Abortive infection alpha
MTAETPKDPTTAFAEELAKQLPAKAIYEDVAKPAATQLGQIAQDLVKTIQLALAPLQFLGAFQDRLRSFIDRSVRAVPEERRISPPPQILGPVVEGIRYEPEGTPLDEMFQHLLSSSMDSERVSTAHPAFPALIRQLSSDEARILVLLKDRQYNYVHTRSYEPDTGLFHGWNVEIDDLPKADLIFPDNVQLYMQHLDKLGLAGLFQHVNQEPLFTEKTQTGVRVRSKYQLTEFGKQFVSACT